jgi:hypothetical protein
VEVRGLHIEKFLNAGASIVEQSQKEVVPWTLASGAINLAEEVDGTIPDASGMVVDPQDQLPPVR